MKKNCNILYVLLVLLFPVSLHGQDLKASGLQRDVQECIKKVRETSVCLYEFDTLANRIIGPQFSGVVVSSDGLILTAAHACEPSRVYLVTFPNGKQQIGMGLGSIQSIDAAALKIVKPGVYPYAKIGRSSLLYVNQPCISIAYPGSFVPKIPVVRFGYVANVLDTERKMIRTTCLMEPGDSGGPVFDLDGAVIGIRSSIDRDLESNFEVPVDLFRKYWSALKKPVDYVKLPQEDSVPAESVSTKDPFATVTLLSAEINRLKYKLNDHTILLMNDDDGSKVLGTVLRIRVPNSNRSEKNYVIGKSSLIQNVVSMIGDRGQKESLKVVFRDDNQDLVLLEKPGKAVHALEVMQLSKGKLVSSQLGGFLISATLQRSGEISVLGTLETDLKATFNTGYLGAGAELLNGQNLISFVQDRSPAELAGLLPGDEIISVNGISVSTPDLFVDEVQKSKANDVILLALNRNNNGFKLNVKLGVRPLVTSTHVAERFEGGKSERRDGFKYVFVHDAKLKPSECGGPLFDLGGKFMGINIARYSRTSSLAISAAGVSVFLQQAFVSPMIQSQLKTSGL